MKKVIRVILVFTIVYLVLSYLGQVKVICDTRWEYFMYNLKLYWINKTLVAAVTALLVEIVSSLIICGGKDE